MKDWLIIGLIPLFLVLHLSLKDPATLFALLAAGCFAVWKARKPEEGPNEIRDKRIREQISKHGSKLRIGRHEWRVEITPTGDGIYHEVFENVIALAGAVSSIEGVLRTDTGFLLDPEYRNFKPKGQSVEWLWTDRKGANWASKTVFNPPVKNRPIGYDRVRKTVNVVFFNQRDRDDSLWGTQDRTQPESIGHRLRQVVDEFLLEIIFPEGRFPAKYWPEALNADGLDLEETQRVVCRPFDNVRTLTLGIGKPLPGYAYRIAWDLPEKETEEKPVGYAETVRAESIARALVSLPVNGGQAVRDALGLLAIEIEKAYWPSGAPPDISIALFGYRRQGMGGGGLHPVAQYNRKLQPDERVKIGRTLVGQCYRRNAEVAFSRYRGEEYYEPLPGEEGLEKPAVAICVPLTCPEPYGLRVGVLMLDTRQPGTLLDKVFEDEDEMERLATRLHKWYIEKLGSALNITIPVRTHS